MLEMQYRIAKVQRQSRVLRERSKVFTEASTMTYGENPVSIHPCAVSIVSSEDGTRYTITYTHRVIDGTCTVCGEGYFFRSDNKYIWTESRQ